MADTGMMIVGQGLNVSRSGGSNWSNSNGISSKNTTSYASSNGSTASNYLVGRRFGFLVPGNSTILGVRVSVSGVFGGNLNLCLFDNNSPVGVAKTHDAGSGGSEQTIFLGDSTDTWGVSGLTPSQVNDLTFGVGLWKSNEFKSATRVHWMEAQIFFEETAGGGVFTQDGGVWKEGSAYVRDGGIWKPSQQYVRDGGIWKS